MASKIFLDANILLDFFLKRENYSSARQLMKLVVEGKSHGFITPSVVHILAYWLSKAYGNTTAKTLLQNLLVDVTVIDCSHSVALTALHSKINDMEDALQYYTALAHKIDYFISSDKQLRKSALPILPVVNSAEYLDLI